MKTLALSRKIPSSGTMRPYRSASFNPKVQDLYSLLSPNTILSIRRSYVQHFWDAFPNLHLFLIKVSQAGHHHVVFMLHIMSNHKTIPAKKPFHGLSEKMYKVIKHKTSLAFFFPWHFIQWKFQSLCCHLPQGLSKKRFFFQLLSLSLLCYPLNLHNSFDAVLAHHVDSLLPIMCVDVNNYVLGLREVTINCFKAYSSLTFLSKQSVCKKILLRHPTFHVRYLLLDRITNQLKL
jgi:hypothetical protein